MNLGFCSQRFSSWVHLSATLKAQPSLWIYRFLEGWIEVFQDMTYEMATTLDKYYEANPD
jgi:hypothetical protein